MQQVDVPCTTSKETEKSPREELMLEVGKALFKFRVNNQLPDSVPVRSKIASSRRELAILLKELIQMDADEPDCIPDILDLDTKYPSPTEMSEISLQELSPDLRHDLLVEIIGRYAMEAE